MPTNQLNLHKIEQTDALYRAFEKINYNFEQISINGGGPSGKRGLTGLPGISGIAGPAGLAGAKGNDGTRGSIWTVGNGAPASGTSPLLGDLYLDLLTSDIYQFNGTNWDLKGSLGASQNAAGQFFKKGTTSNTVTNLDGNYQLLLTSNVTETGTNIGGLYKLKVFNSGVNGSNIRIANQDARAFLPLWEDYSGFVINSYWNPSISGEERLIIQGLRSGDYSSHKQYANLVFDRITLNRGGDNPDTDGPFFLLGAPESVIDINDKKTYGIVGGPVRFVSNTTGGTDFNDGAFRWNTDHFEYFYSGTWNSFDTTPSTVDPEISLSIDSIGAGPLNGLATISLSSPSSGFTATTFQLKAMTGITFSNESGKLGISAPAGGGGGISDAFSSVEVRKDNVLVGTYNATSGDNLIINAQNDLDISITSNQINISYDSASNDIISPERMNFFGSRITYSMTWLSRSRQLLGPNRLGPLRGIWRGAENLAFPQDPARYEQMAGVLASAWRPDIDPTVGISNMDARVSSWGWPQASTEDAHKYQKVVLYTPIKQSKMGAGQFTQTAKLEYDFTTFKTSDSPAVSSLIETPSALRDSTQFTDTVTDRNYVFSFDHRRAPSVLNKIRSISSNDGKVSFYRVSVVAYAYVNTLIGSLSNIGQTQQIYTGLGSPIPIHTAVMVYDSTVPWGLQIPTSAGPSPFYDQFYGDGSTYASPVIYSYLSTHTREVSPAQFSEGTTSSNDLIDYYAVNSLGSTDFISRLNLSKLNSVNEYNFKNTVQCNHIIKVESSDVIPLRYNEVAEVGFVMEKEYDDVAYPWGTAADFDVYTSYNNPANQPNIGMKIIRAGVNVIYAHVNFELIGSNQL